MYKIVYLCMPGQEDVLQEHHFGLLDESFETKEKAVEWLKSDKGPIAEDKRDFLEGYDEEELEDIEGETDFSVEEYAIDGVPEIDYEVYQYGDLVYRHEYKVLAC